MNVWETVAPMLVAMLLLCSCADIRGGQFTVDARSSLSADSARNLAKQEINRRGLPLPKNWHAEVRDSFVDYEFRRSRAIFAVTFYALVKGKRKDLYEVNIDKRSAKVEDFLDVRRAVPIHIH
jgi:hypothetical protein